MYSNVVVRVQVQSNFIFVARKLVSWHNPGCTVTEVGYRLEISDLGSRDIVIHVSIECSENKGVGNCAIAAQLICAFIFANAKSSFFMK